MPTHFPQFLLLSLPMSRILYPKISSHNSAITPSPSQPPHLESTANQPLPTPSDLRYSKVVSVSSPSPASVRTGSSSPSFRNNALGIIILGTVLGGLVIFFTVVLVLCYKKIKNEGPLDQDRSPPSPSNDIISDPPPAAAAAALQQLNQSFHAPEVNGAIPIPNLTEECSSRPENIQNSRGKSVRFSAGNFTTEDLALATRHFAGENFLGEGTFGYVHKGILPNGKKIVVKRLKKDSAHGDREFLQEIENISGVHHRNLVALMGYCVSGDERFLVYEFVPNNSLEFHLHGEDQPVMEWEKRMKIAIESAKALAYIHEDFEPSIIHCDIKASNILLDHNFEPKIADFGLAKFYYDTDHDITNAYTGVVATFGYLAPEFVTSGRASDKSDVFSYGVLLVELISGRKPLNNVDPSTSDCLVSWAKPLLTRALANREFDLLVDPRLRKNYNREEMTIMIACAVACLRSSMKRRPLMSQVIRVMEGDVSISELDEGNGKKLDKNSTSYGGFDTRYFGT